ncbi:MULTISPECIES: DUF6252 family protein [Flavobacterium]|uniref:DUF6252 family protein n=1 Tax=Flavobacterium TaxID=237 RepID=UPI00391BC1DA
MKNIKFLTGIFLILTAFTFTSCDNEPIDPAIDLDNFGGGGNNGGPVVFKADFSGSTWNATSAQADITNGVISIVGFRGSNGEGFGFQVLATSTGTYPANANLLVYTPANSEYGYWSINPDNAQADTGSITITEIDTVNKTISGTFNFTGYWSDTLVTNILPTVFSNGVFENIPYESDSTPVTDDTFSAKFDGVDFVEDQIDVVQILANESPFAPVAISIVGSQNANDDNVGLRIPYSIAVGTYSFDTNTANFGGSSIQDGLLYVAQSGTVTIISKTATRIKGTFSYEAYNFTTNTTKQVTAGTFDVEYN